MIFLLILLGLFLGLVTIGDSAILIGIISLILLIFILYRFGKKEAIFYFVSFAIGIGLSFLVLRLNPTSGTYTGVVIETKDDYFVFYSKLEKLIVYEKNNSKEVGDILTINGTISDVVDTSLESSFSFASYLENKGIGRVLNVSQTNTNFETFLRLKAYRNWFLGHFDSDSKALLSAFLFNSKDYDSEIIAKSNELSILYLFSTSGLMISLVLKGVTFFFSLFLKDKWAKLCGFITLSWYFVFALNRIAVVRLVLVKIFSLINEFFLKKKFDYLSIISIVGITMLLADHFLAKQLGFYLGYFLILSLYFLSSFNNRGKKYKGKVRIFIIMYFLTLPISISFSNSFHVLGLLYQVVLFPICSIYSLSGLIALYTLPINGYFYFLSKILNGVITGISYIDVALPVMEWPSYAYLIYYSLLFFILYVYESYEFNRMGVAICVLTTLFIIPLFPVSEAFVNQVSFLYVGQGDCSIIRNKDITVMIDTGGLTYKDVAKESLIPYMNKCGIKDIDYVFISHSDNDHSGALNSLKQNFKVKNIITTSETFSLTIKDIAITNINKWAKDMDNENDMSQVLKVTFLNKTFLYMGDASTTIESYILKEYPDLTCDILKAGHHGSDTSSSKSFLKQISPKEAVVSVGINNSYGHPSDSVIKTLNSLGINIRRTDLEGTITYN